MVFSRLRPVEAGEDQTAQGHRRCPTFFPVRGSTRNTISGAAAGWPEPRRSSASLAQNWNRLASLAAVVPGRYPVPTTNSATSRSRIGMDLGRNRVDGDTWSKSMTATAER